MSDHLQIEWKHISVTGFSRNTWMKTIRKALPCLIFGNSEFWLSPHIVGIIDSQGKLP